MEYSEHSIHLPPKKSDILHLIIPAHYLDFTKLEAILISKGDFDIACTSDEICVYVTRDKKLD